VNEARREAGRAAEVALGEFRVASVIDMGRLELPGFHVFPDFAAEAVEEQADWLVPRYIDPASRKLLMAFQGFLVRTPRHTILVDSCIGNHKERPNRLFWHQRTDSPFLDNLARLGVAPEQIDFVLCTHLHADHVGWNTRLDNGRWVPTFPKARYIFARREYETWERAYREDPAEPHTYGSFADSVLPVMEAGRAVLVEQDHQVEDGVWLEPAPGHTPGTVTINIESGGQRAICSGDVLHHPIQCTRPDWSSRFCDDPDQSRRTRAALLDRLAETDVRLFAAHFVAPRGGYIVRAGRHFRFRP
jgi:glyoxylase-like metal-dependent hydrolase (beta-lactamase superfamily II)